MRERRFRQRDVLPGQSPIGKAAPMTRNAGVLYFSVQDIGCLSACGCRVRARRLMLSFFLPAHKPTPTHSLLMSSVTILVSDAWVTWRTQATFSIQLETPSKASMHVTYSWDDNGPTNGLKKHFAGLRPLWVRPQSAVPGPHSCFGDAYVGTHSQPRSGCDGDFTVSVCTWWLRGRRGEGPGDKKGCGMRLLVHSSHSGGRNTSVWP